MVDEAKRRRPWEQEKPQLSAEQMRNQLARLLAVGALQKVRRARVVQNGPDQAEPTELDMDP